MTYPTRDVIIKLWDLAMLETTSGLDAMEYFARAIIDRYGQPAANAEPVAWRWKWEGYPWTYSDDPKPSPPMKGMIREPLYAAPVAAQEPAA